MLLPLEASIPLWESCCLNSNEFLANFSQQDWPTKKEFLQRIFRFSTFSTCSSDELFSTEGKSLWCIFPINPKFATNSVEFPMERIVYEHARVFSNIQRDFVMLRSTSIIDAIESSSSKQSQFVDSISCHNFAIPTHECHHYCGLKQHIL